MQNTKAASFFAGVTSNKRVLLALVVAGLVSAYGWTVFSRLRAQQFSILQKQQPPYGGTTEIPNVAFETFKLFAVAFVATYVVSYLTEQVKKNPATITGGGAASASASAQMQVSLEDVMKHVDELNPPF